MFIIHISLHKNNAMAICFLELAFVVLFASTFFEPVALVSEKRPAIYALVGVDVLEDYFSFSSCAALILKAERPPGLGAAVGHLGLPLAHADQLNL